MYLILNSEKEKIVKNNIQLIEQQVHFKHDEKSFHTYKDFFVISWRKGTKLYNASDLIYEDVKNNLLVIIQGYIWDSSNAGTPLIAQDIHGRLLRHNFDIESIKQTIIGEYSVAAITSDKVYVFNDNLGIENIYFSTSHNTFICNRMSLFENFSKENLDLESMLFLPTLGYRFAENTLYKKLKVLPQGAHIECSGHKIKIIRNPFFFITEKDRERNSILLEEGLHISIKFLEGVFADEEVINLGITGGMDSRLVLALLINSDLKNRVRLFTNGYPEAPDVIVGKTISESLGIEHVNNIPTLDKNNEHSFNKIIENFHIHSYQNEGMFGGWDMKANRKAGNRVVLTGLVGELLKGYCKQPFNYHEKPAPTDFIPKQGLIDPLGVITHIDKINRQLEERVDFYLESGCDFNDIPDIFYLKERIPNWLGAARRLDSYSDQSINILNNNKLIQYSFSLSSEERQACLIHFKALNLLSPNLVEIPFAEQRWSKVLLKYGLIEKQSREPVLPKVKTSNTQQKPWQFFINDSKDIRSYFIKLIQEDKSGFASYIDNKKLIDMLQTKTFSYKELISLYCYSYKSKQY